MRLPLFSRRLPPRRGAALLVAVIVVSAIALTVALSASLGSLSGLVTSSREQQSAASLAGAEACVDEALVRLVWDDAYAGGSFGMGEAACQIGVSGLGSTRTIQATSTVATFVRKIEVGVSLGSSGLTITQWGEDTD